MIQPVEQRVKVIVGLGKTGMSCARYFQATGEPFRVIDSRFSPPELPEFEREFPDGAIELGGFSERSLQRAAEIVLSPGVSLKTPEIAKAVAAGVPVTGDIDIFSRVVKAPIIAVTGSNGKSTVVTLVADMARRASVRAGLGGNLDGKASVPALDLLRGDERELYVLELSSFQLETTAHLGAEVAVILNLSEDHLDRYDSPADYAAAKQRIFAGARQVLINRDDAASAPQQPTDATVWSYGLSAPETANDVGVISTDDGRDWIVIGEHRIMPVADLGLSGVHNTSNAMAALGLGRAIGLPESAMVAALREFNGLPHRCQLLRTLRGVRYVNDSKGTNVGATLTALQSVKQGTEGQIVLIAGGLAKGADFTPLLPALASGVRQLVLIGRDADQLAAVVDDRVPVVRAASLEAAVHIAADVAQEGDVVLLSPACASQDMFKDFAHRGRVFASTVGKLT